MILTKRQQSLFRGNGSGVGTLSARETADAVITALTPAAWYRNATDVVSSGGFASIWADYASTAKGLALPGVAGNYASTPDSVPISVTGDIDLIARMSLKDWTPSAAMTVMAKWGSAGQFSWLFYVNTSGTLVLFQTLDGSTGTNVNSGSALTVSNGDTIWVRVTRVSSSGLTTFYQAADSTTVPSSWTTVGSASLASGSLFDSTSAIEIGADSAGAARPANGIIYRAIVKNGIGGTTVFDADFSAQAIGTASFTESSSNAATVTINTSGASPAHIGKARDLLQGTGTNQPAYDSGTGVVLFDGVDNFMRATFTLDQPETVVLVLNQVAWTLADTIFDGNTTNVMRLLQAGDNGVGSSAQVVQYAGSYGIFTTTTAMTIGTFAILIAVYNGASSVIRVNNQADFTTGGTCGASNAGGFVLGAQGDGGGTFSNMECKEAIVFSSAIADADRSALVTALANALSVTL